MHDQQADITKITVAITTPGWPASHFPNGIVTYVHNILVGFGAHIDTAILASKLSEPEVKNRLVDLSKVKICANIFSKTFDHFLFKTQLTFTRAIRYKKMIDYSAKKIALALEDITPIINVIETDESYGTALPLINMTTVPVIVRLHGPWFTMGAIMKEAHLWHYPMRVFYEGEAIKHAHGVTSPSLDVLNQVRDYYGLTLTHAQVIPNPVLPVAKKSQWQLDDREVPVLLFVGRFDLLKGGDLILQAFRIIGAQHTTISLCFVGPDRGVMIENNKIDIKRYLEKFVPESDIKNRMQFLGHCDHNQISDLRKKALVTVVCSRYETFSIALVESLAAGCPTVATAVGGMKEIIIDDFNGLLAEPESAESIAEKVLMLISDPEKMQRLSKNAIEDCKKRFSPEVVAAQTVEYYQSVLARVSNSTAKN